MDQARIGHDAAEQIVDRLVALDRRASAGAGLRTVAEGGELALVGFLERHALGVGAIEIAGDARIVEARIEVGEIPFRQAAEPGAAISVADFLAAGLVGGAARLADAGMGSSWVAGKHIAPWQAWPGRRTGLAPYGDAVTYQFAMPLDGAEPTHLGASPTATLSALVVPRRMRGQRPLNTALSVIGDSDPFRHKPWCGCVMSERVLIVDDDPVQRRLLEHMVGRFGYETLIAEGGDAAMALLTGEGGPSIDVVVLDLVMPDLDGIGVLARLREAGSALPVIVQTAHGGIDNVVSAMRAGATDFVVKPVSPERLQVSLATRSWQARCRASSPASSAAAPAP